MRSSPYLRDRMIADPLFLFKIGAEIIIDSGEDLRLLCLSAAVKRLFQGLCLLDCLSSSIKARQHQLSESLILRGCCEISR